MDKRDGINRKIMKKYLKDYFIYNIKYNANSRNPIKIEKDREQNMIKYSIHFVYLINHLLQNYYSIYYEE